ncbi:MAG: acylphosphatase [Pirellulales bacterium]
MVILRDSILDGHQRKSVHQLGNVRVEILYCGHVQGVGFRYTARSLAQRYAVTGFVKNLPDRSVQLVAEGMPDEVDRFLEAVVSAVRENIRDVKTERLPAVGDFSTFEIAF